MSVAPSAPKSKGSGSSAALAPSAAGKRKPWDLQGRVKDLKELVSSLAGDKKELQILHKEKEQQVGSTLLTFRYTGLVQFVLKLFYLREPIPAKSVEAYGPYEQ